MSSDFFCRFCQIQCNGKAPYDQHVASAKHLKKMSLAGATSLNEPAPNDFNSKMINLSRTPSIEKSLTSSFDSLLTSDTTISKETMRILLEWNHPMNYKPFCEVCQLVLNGGDNATIHFSSENLIHREKVNAFRRISEGTVNYSCSICAEIFDSEKQMVTHFYLDSHSETKQRKSLLQKFIRLYETFNELKTIRGKTFEIYWRSSFNENLSGKRLHDSLVIDPSLSHIEKKCKRIIFTSDELKKTINYAKMEEHEELVFD